jgi:MinD-like ATPase involved in chromosome partitioning or flagellar assembly
VSIANEPNEGPAVEEAGEAGQLLSQPRPAGRVITVFSPKGGTGKTVISTNLAVALNADGISRVCLVDLDLEFGDVAISLGLTPVRSLIDAVDQDESLDEDEQVNALLTSWRRELDCVLAPVSPGEAEKISPALVNSLIKKLRARYDYVVIDTPAQFSEHVLEALDASDHHVLITTPEIPALKNLRLTLDMLDLLAYRNASRAIVLNRGCPPKMLRGPSIARSPRKFPRVRPYRRPSTWAFRSCCPSRIIRCRWRFASSPITGSPEYPSLPFGVPAVSA